jgi:hypothetical protein
MGQDNLTRARTNQGLMFQPAQRQAGSHMILASPRLAAQLLLLLLVGLGLSQRGLASLTLWYDELARAKESKLARAH